MPRLTFVAKVAKVAKVDTLMQEEGIKHSVTFMDDILTYGNSLTQYVAAQRQLLKSLRTRSWLIAADKLRLGYQ